MHRFLYAIGLLYLTLYLHPATMIMLPNVTKIYFLHSFLVALKSSLLSSARLSLFLVFCLWIILNPKSSNVYALIQ